MGTPERSLTTSALAEATGRRGPDVRRHLHDLAGMNLVVEPEPDVWALPPDFWEQWAEVLYKSGVIRAEDARQRSHAAERDSHRDRVSKKSHYVVRSKGVNIGRRDV